MIPKTDWNPSPSDIAWQRDMLRILKNGAVWGVPVSLSSFKFDKTNKTFCLIVGDPAHETNRRIAKVLQALGYAETEKTGEEDNDDDV
jgi:hypothetical protein